MRPWRRLRGAVAAVSRIVPKVARWGEDNARDLSIGLAANK